MRLKLNTSDILSQKDEAMKVLKEEIRSHMETRNIESYANVSMIKRYKFSRQQKFLEKSLQKIYAHIPYLRKTLKKNKKSKP